MWNIESGLENMDDRKYQQRTHSENDDSTTCRRGWPENQHRQSKRAMRTEANARHYWTHRTRPRATLRRLVGNRRTPLFGILVGAPPVGILPSPLNMSRITERGRFVSSRRGHTCQAWLGTSLTGGSQRKRS